MPIHNAQDASEVAAQARASHRGRPLDWIAQRLLDANLERIDDRARGGLDFVPRREILQPDRSIDPVVFDDLCRGLNRLGFRVEFGYAWRWWPFAVRPYIGKISW